MNIKVEPQRVPVSQEERELARLMVITQQGDSNACRELLERLNSLLQKYVAHSLRRSRVSPEGRSEDIVQEILLAIYQKRATYDPGQCFLPWVFGIARYKVVDSFRTSKRADRWTRLEGPKSGDGATITDVSAALDVESLLLALPRKQKILLGLVKIEGFTVAEASSKTGYSESDVKVSIHRAIRALRKRMLGK